MCFRGVCAAACLMLAAGMMCRSEAAGGSKIYNHLVIKAFDTPGGAELPADFAQMLRRNLKLSLGRTNRFREITVVEIGDPVPANADMELSGRITRFKEGSAAKRYLTLPGIGATRINATVEFKELPTNQAVYKAEVSGKVFSGSNSLYATDMLANDVAKIVKKKLP